MLNQDFKLSVEFGYAFAFGYRADNDTKVFRLEIGRASCRERV